MYSPSPSFLSRFFPLLFLFVCCWMSAPAGAQIRLKTVTVLLDQEADDIFGVPSPVMLTWDIEGSPPPGAKIEFQRASDNEVSLLPIETVSLDDFNGNYIWGDEEALPGDWSERYALMLVDENGQVIQGFELSEIHGTIFLRELDAAADFDPCSRTITWRWDDYVYNSSESSDEEDEPPIEPFFNHIQLMVLPPDETEEVIAATSDFNESLQMREATYVFEHGPGNYRFRVRAVENPDVSGRKSYSNWRDFDFVSPVIDDPEITSVDVVDNQYIELGIILQGSVDEFTYEVLRSDPADQDFEVVGTLDAAAPGLNAYSDMAVPDLQQDMWYYRVEARIRDASCEDPAYESPAISSLFLSGEVTVQTDDRLEVLLSWDQQPAWENFVLQRNLPNGDGWTNIGTPFSSPGQTTDNLSAFLQDLSGEIRYRMLGERLGETVHSNEYQVVIEPKVEIPNVFRPDAVDEENRVFKPVFVGFTPSFIRLRVYNRWGQEVFSITNPETGWPGWDGRLNDGGEAPPGMYAYWLEYELPDSARKEVRGSVMLIK